MVKLLVAFALVVAGILVAQPVASAQSSASPSTSTTLGYDPTKGVVRVDPSSGPAIGASPIGSPTYVVPPAPAAPQKAGGFINVGQAFNEAVGPYVDALVQASIAALLGWLALKIQQRTGVQVEDSRRDALTRFLQNQASSLIADGKVKLSGLKVEVNDDALANSANLALSRVPDAMKAFGLTPEAVAAKIVDAIPQTAAGAQIVAQAHAPAAQALAPKPPAAAAPAPQPQPPR